jgi:hypothetical protein
MGVFAIVQQRQPMCSLHLCTCVSMHVYLHHWHLPACYGRTVKISKARPMSQIEPSVCAC